MLLDDDLSKACETLSQQIQGIIGKESVDAAIKTIIISRVPLIGTYLATLISNLAIKRTFERTTELFTLIAKRIEHVGTDKVDKEFFKTEEFQTLLFLAMEQLQTTHDKTKIEMLANALANSATLAFSSEERKEFFVRTLRDLSPHHVRVLKELMPADRELAATPTFWPTKVEPTGEELGILQSLTAGGMVEDFLTLDKNRNFPELRFGNAWGEREIKEALRKYINVAPRRNFRISRLGIDFLNFVGGTPASQASPQL